MRDKFPEYYQPTKAEFEELWNKALIIFDTNVLLNLYRYSPESSKEVIKVLEHEKICERLWLPYQVGLEYQRNRLEVINDQTEEYEKLQEFLKQIRKNISDKLCLIKHPFVSNKEEFFAKLDALFSEIENELEKNKTNSEAFAKDDLHNKISSLFAGRVGEPYSFEELKKIFVEGKTRFEQKIPPGFLDKSKKKDQPDSEIYGDLIIWKQTLEKAREISLPIIFVTEETKKDWWWRVKGKTIAPHPLLISEMKKEANVEFYLYSLKKFIEYAQDYIGKRVNQSTIDEMKAVNEFDQDMQVNNLISTQVYPQPSVPIGDSLKLASNSIIQSLELLRQRNLQLAQAFRLADHVTPELSESLKVAIQIYPEFAESIKLVSQNITQSLESLKLVSPRLENTFKLLVQTSPQLNEILMRADELLLSNSNSEIDEQLLKE